MRRVVVTGMGIVSSIGDTAQEVLESLQAGRSGIVKAQEYADLGFRCQVHGAPKLNPFEALDRRTTRFMGQGAAWNYIAMQQAKPATTSTPCSRRGERPSSSRAASVAASAAA